MSWLPNVVVLSLLAVACGGNATPQASSAPSDSSAATNSSLPTDSSVTEPGTGPQFGSEEFGLTMEQLAIRIEQVEGVVGECMRAAGFEYVPVDFVTVRRAMTSDKSAPGLSDEDYRTQFGYGVSTQFDKPAVALGFGEQNQAIFDNLAEADQVAYKQALYGENADATFAIALEAEDFSGTGGCTRTAIEQVFQADELTAAYNNPGDVLIEQDPRVIAAIEAWSACLAESGFDYSHPNQIEEDFGERLAAIAEGQDPQTLTGDAQNALVELQGEERAVAVADFDCAEELLEPVIETVEAEIYGAPQG